MSEQERRSCEMKADFYIMEDAAELCNTGYAYDTGTEGKPQDSKIAMQYYLKAAKMGNAYAQFNAGYNYYHGEGTAQNFEKAEKWFYEAAKQLHIPAYYMIAQIYHHHEQPDMKQAVYWYERAAVEEAENTINAQNALLKIYSDNESDYFDGEKAVYWLNTLAKNGDEAAIEKLGSEGENYTWTTYMQLSVQYKSEQDPEKEIYWLHKAAIEGNVMCMCSFANKIDNEDANEIDKIYALYWYNTAADAGDRVAQLELAEKYKDGNGVEKDIEKALYWARKAVENQSKTGDADFDKGMEETTAGLLNFLEALYVEDIDLDTASSEQLYNAAQILGFDERDIDKGVEYSEIAAMRGNAEAAFLAFRFYIGNQDTYPNAEKLYYWWLNAAAKGNFPEAVEAEKEIRPTLTDENIISMAYAEQMATDYREQGDDIRAYYWYSVVGKQDGYPNCAYWAGWYCFYGKGTWKNQKNYAWALYFLQKAAANPGLQEYLIAQIYLTGGYGVERDLNEAVKWYEKAIAIDGEEITSDYYTGLGHAYLKLGEMDKAFDCYNKAEQCEEEAMKLLEEMREELSEEEGDEEDVEDEDENEDENVSDIDMFDDIEWEYIEPEDLEDSDDE